MDFSAHLLFFFSLVGVFNGFILSALLLVKFQEAKALRWVSVLLILLCIRIGKSVLFYFNPELDKTILQIGLSAYFLLGPCLLNFVLASYSKTKNRYLTIHFLALSGFIIGFGIFMPYQLHPEIWQTWGYKGTSYFWLGYLLISSYTFYRLATAKSANNNAEFHLSMVVICGCWLIWAAYFFSSFTSYITGALTFSFVLYLSILFAPKLLRKPSANEKKYANTHISDEEYNQLIAKLESLMSESKLFTEPDLTLPRLAKRLGTSHNKLSQIVNRHYHCNFKQYLNGLRVEYAKHLLSSTNMPLEHLALECGFNSASTFFAAFKKLTGYSPNNFKHSENILSDS
ncbi:helix-turn-helix domain-containing protein [Pseudoalteromonas piscicida]|uniref:helix-turn-helix domain-containing protein n=1 Tax=Pseudoalteromonas piscicida TaxID=43662 RepID=UPI0027E4BD55|nr:AraC family transcriptional regulator [Pseudoalteromonas piscicida]WMO13053.1 AraC family transcriptional regulator [Pseudoalteromonas piscicida]